jgi:hypothetical protein
MTFDKLKKIITIWLKEEVVNNEVKINQIGSGGSKETGKSGENKFYQIYSISSNDDRWYGKCARLYINTYIDINKKPTYFTIGFDHEDDKMKCDNYEVLIVYPDNETYMTGKGNISIHFSNYSITKLRHMINNADAIITEWLEKHPKFDMDEAHAIHITNVIFKECDNIEIRFIANNRIFNSKNKLYVGFEIFDENDDEHNYVFGVTEKHISISNPFSFKFDKAMINPFYEYEYVATFRGYIRPTEEEIINATFRWVVSKEIIKKAYSGALFTL